MSIINITPKGIAYKPDATSYTPSITYNQAGVTYNDLRYTYNDPHVNLTSSIKPVNALNKQIYPVIEGINIQ